ncbi:MAG: putative signal transducing protein [Dehalococcoidia bacterium]
MGKKKGPQGMVRIGVARDQVEAAIWRDALEQEGIKAFIKNVDPLAALPYVESSTPFSFEVFVPAADERRARWILGLPPAQDGPAGAAK